MPYCEGTIVLKELQRLFHYFNKLRPERYKIWLSSDSYNGIARAMDFSEQNRLLILEEICKNNYLPLDFIEKSLSLDSVKLIGATFPDILYYYTQKNITWIIGEELKKSSDKNALAQVISFRPWVNYAYAVMPNPKLELVDIFKYEGIGLIEIINHQRVFPVEKSKDHWKLLVKPKSVAQFEKIQETFNNYVNKEINLISKGKYFEPKNPLITNYSRLDHITGLSAVLMNFSNNKGKITLDFLRNEIYQSEILHIKQSTRNSIINNLPYLLNNLKKIGIVHERKNQFIIDHDSRKEISEINSLLKNGEITSYAYKRIIKSKLQRYVLKNLLIINLVEYLKKLSGGANIIRLFQEIGKKDLFLLANLFTNCKNPCGVLYDKPDICNGCSKGKSCSLYLQNNGKEKFEEIWKFIDSSKGEGKANEFFQSIINEDYKKYNKYVKNEVTFPLFVKFAVSRSLNFGKHLLSDLEILEKDTKKRDKAEGKYCPWEDNWILHEGREIRY